ncbi:hypothetical protein EFR39_01120 [Limosilactobacillus fermentum]|uniref:Uncharacterized protein n=2 Tax=Limosilactobacillus fermentum TaxID=1613 RepID=A0A4Z0CDY8_LIMFE|nr:hypothetical protein [Limosilactobacillus fermentum]AKM50887.1 hypothetical protein N573_003760 [Limosilactobacillus fermentum 3872]KAB1958795.1 hypothetical protein F8252_07655 [Limosilactobacillus fermentum]MCH5388098.1 hypothetical protein [Limosilactobacillus fermentum]MCT3454591.1 hypothetical protein [Limosilactobacillus fermentum]MCT3460621.1 hypothetical protein [Limosilactobacillus fermentum]
MKRVANNRRYYELLHQLENLDPKWSENIGKEGKLNNYYTEGDVNVPGEVIIKCREILAELRAMVDVIERRYQNEDSRVATRLLVTLYNDFGLSNKEIAEIFDYNESTLRHDYPAFKDGEVVPINPFVKLKDEYGKHISAS